MARRQPYEHNSTPPVPEPETDLNNDNKIWLSDITQPAEKPLEVRLDEDPSVSAPEEKPDDKPELAVQAPEPKPDPVEAKPSADDEAFKRLKAQLDRERAARESDRERLRQLESDRTQAHERLRQEQERYYAAQREQLDAQELAIDNAISSLENQAAHAKREFSRALSEGDYEAASAANEALAEAKANLGRLRDGKSAIESQKKAPAPQREEVQQQQYQPNSLYDRIESYITQPGHSLRVQQFLRDHYDDLFSDFDSGANRLSRLLGGHYLTKSDGVIEGSDAYFDHLSQHMGYTKAPDPEPVAAAPPPRQTKHVPPAAPVSRGSNGSSGSPTSITLTPAQVALCRETGVDPREYARNLLKMKAGAQDPNYTGPRFTADLG